MLKLMSKGGRLQSCCGLRTWLAILVVPVGYLSAYN
jgi:hypothetical protein